MFDLLTLQNTDQYENINGISIYEQRGIKNTHFKISTYLYSKNESLKHEK